MLARHLLFIATRRHHNTLLAIDSVPSHGIVQPPPYISPSKLDEPQKQKIQEILKAPPTCQKIQTCEKQQTTVNYGQQSAHPPNIYPHDLRRNLCNSNDKFFEQSKTPYYNDLQHDCDQRQIVYMRNARNQQYYASGKDVSRQFYTLPSRRLQRDVEPPRSVTPDITRGLGRSSLSTMHVIARHGQKVMVEQDPNCHGSQMELSKRTPEIIEMDNKLMQSQEQQPIVDFRNRFATPLGLTALGYRFFASSPVRDPVTKSPSADALKYNPISPIEHGYGNSFKSSTPTGRSMPTVAERLAQTANNSLSMPNSGRSTPVQSSSGRSTPTNLILSPTKSTMSNEELFAAIHKSKKRLNIKEDNENSSPYGSTNSLVKMISGSSNSCSSESQKTSATQNVQPSSPATSRLDFKRLLLQQSVKTGPVRVSAAEQLKLSRQQNQQQQSSNVQQTTSLAKVLSPRSVWRFQTPRTDVLSSTIIEDTAAEEKAMKPSPENTSPVLRLNVRRQLDLCSDESNKDSIACNDRLKFSNIESSDTKAPDIIETESSSKNVQTTNAQQAFTKNSTVNNNNNRETSASVPSFPSTLPSVSITSDTHSQSKTTNFTTISYPVNCSQLTPSCQQAISAFESRRISNQLARAQFLSGTSTNQEHHAYAKNMFRARSESPQNPTMQNVARSPSVPTLETAL